MNTWTFGKGKKLLTSARRNRRGPLAPSDSLFSFTIMLNRRAHELFRQLSGPNLTPSQYFVLLAVASHDACSQHELTQLSGVDRATLSDVVQRLEKKKMVARREDPKDRRAYAVSITAAGRKAVRKAIEWEAALMRELFKALTSSQREEVLSGLNAITDIIPPERDDAPA